MTDFLLYSIRLIKRRHTPADMIKSVVRRCATSDSTSLRASGCGKHFGARLITKSLLWFAFIVKSSVQYAQLDFYGDFHELDEPFHDFRFCKPLTHFAADTPTVIFDHTRCRWGVLRAPGIRLTIFFCHGASSRLV